jgi:hypothetical protein
MSQDVLIETLSTIYVQYKPLMPTTETLTGWIEAGRGLDAHAISKKILKKEEVRALVPIFRDAANGMDSKEIRETLLSFAEINYPSIIEMLTENEEDGQKMMDTLKVITEVLVNGSA